MYCVYKHTSPSNKTYVGITKQNPLNRWHNGFGYKNNPHFWKAIVKYGWVNFKHEILFDGLTKAQAEAIEIELISEYKSNDRRYGYNLDNGGNCIGSFSEEHKRKIGEAHKGNKYCLGRKLSEETKAKISAKHKGRPSPTKGIKFPKERCEKISKSLMGKLVGKLNPRSKPVLCIESNEQFDCIRNASTKFGIDPSSITACCRGRRKSAGGYHWKYTT